MRAVARRARGVGAGASRIPEARFIGLRLLASEAFAYPMRANTPVTSVPISPSVSEAHHAPTAHQVADYVHRAELVMMRSMYFEDLRRFRLLMAGTVGFLLLGVALSWAQIKALFVVRVVPAQSHAYALRPSSLSADKHERICVGRAAVRGRPGPSGGCSKGCRRCAADRPGCA
jgi:hypothetical protein